VENDKMLEINVEAMVGSDIEDVTKDLLDLARRLNLRVNCDFNGTRLSMGPNGNAKSMATDYRKHKFDIVVQ
jgi:hypothetical protein